MSKKEIEYLADRAWLCMASNKQEEAKRLYTKICELDNTNDQAWMMLGKIHVQSMDPVGAEYCFRKVIELDPSRADAYNHLAGALLSQNRLDEAERCCQHALQLNPVDALIYANLGNVLSRLGQLNEAARSYRKALQISPDFIGAYLNLGNTLKLLKEFDQAAEIYRRILAINPQYIDIYNALGECYLKAGVPEKSLECYRTILRIQPRNVTAYMNMGFVFGEIGKYGNAIECYKQALEINPQLPDAYLSRGLIEKKQGHFSEAASSYCKSLELQPDNLDAKLSLSLVELLQGNYTDGWRHYTARKSVREYHTGVPSLFDENLNGKRILVVKDQGLGDEIFFLRFVRELKERGAWLAYLTDPKIESLIKRMPFIDEVKSTSEFTPRYDISVSIGDLPFCMGYGNHTPIPPPVEMTPLQSSLNAVHSLLSGIGPAPYVGITWWAGTRHSSRSLDDRLAYREVPIDQFAESLRDVNATVLILQRDPQSNELDTLSRILSRQVWDLHRLNDDLEGMLALLTLLDEYIGVDNTNMHLSASVGKSCRILVPHPPEWRVMSDGSESPWFPGFSLYRQSASGVWSKALGQLRMDLVSRLV